MKTIKEEIKLCNIKYEAIDGTIFCNKEECENYEKTAKAIIRSKFLKLVIKKEDETRVFNIGSDENSVYFVKMLKVSDVDAVKQFYLLDRSWMLDSADNYQHYIDKVFNTIDDAYKKKDILLIGEDCNGEIYIIGTRQSIIDNLNNIKKS